MNKSKCSNEAMVGGVVKLAKLGYSLKATSQALNMGSHTVRKIATSVDGVEFGNRAFLPRMTLPLNWVNKKVPVNLRPLAKAILRRFGNEPQWPIPVIQTMWSLIDAPLVEKWQKWHLEEQVARCKITIEIDRLEKGLPIRKNRPKGLKYNKEVTETPVYFANGQWFEVPK